MERMDEFFAARVDGYDEHMLMEVEGCKEAYKKMAELVPVTCENLLDLGCGTGLELDKIFKVLPNIKVKGIDLTQAMLDKLLEKHPDKTMTLICGSYFDENFGMHEFDCAVSFQTMHHFSHEAKIGLYKKICDSLKQHGMYIECDYMVEKQEEEDFYYAENRRIRKELHLSEEDFYHYDTPCTIENQMIMFEKAGFSRCEKVFRIGGTTIIVAYV